MEELRIQREKEHKRLTDLVKFSTTLVTSGTDAMFEKANTGNSKTVIDSLTKFLGTA